MEADTIHSGSAGLDGAGEVQYAVGVEAEVGSFPGAEAAADQGADTRSSYSHTPRQVAVALWAAADCGADTRGEYATVGGYADDLQPGAGEARDDA